MNHRPSLITRGSTGGSPAFFFYIFLILFISAFATVPYLHRYGQISIPVHFADGIFSIFPVFSADLPVIHPALVLAILALRHIALGAQCNLYVSLDIFAIFPDSVPSW